MLRRQLRNPHFFQKCCHFRWNHNKVRENDNSFERNEDCATVFLTWTDFNIWSRFESTVKLGNKEWLDKEQLGNSEPFPVTNDYASLLIMNSEQICINEQFCHDQEKFLIRVY